MTSPARQLRYPLRLERPFVLGAMAVLVAIVPACGSAPEVADPAGGLELDSGTADAHEIEDGRAVDAAGEARVDADAEHPVDALPEADAVPTDGPEADSLEDAAADTGSEDSDAAPFPPVCGDGWRDIITEECDDGLGGISGTSRACSAVCTVIDRVVAASPVPNLNFRTFGSPSERRIGFGRHQVAGNSLGHAVTWVETDQGGDEIRIGIAMYTPAGLLDSTAYVPVALYEADPVVAALPDGSFALAFNSADVDGDGLGVAVARVVPGSGVVLPLKAANDSTLFGQHSPDILWTGSELLVGWEDEGAYPRQLFTRRFSAGLSALGAGQAVTQAQGSPSKVSLSSMTGGIVRAWREEQPDANGVYYAVVAVSYGAALWRSDSLGVLSYAESIATAPLGTDHLLVVYDDQQGVSHATVLDFGATPAAPSTVTLNASSQPRQSPSLAVTADGIYLAWQSPAEAPDGGWDPLLDDVWVQKLTWDGTTLDASAAPIPLPHDEWTLLGDQRRPALFAIPYSPSGALLAAWEDLGAGNYAGQCERGDVIVSVIPTPILRGGQ